MVQRNQGCDQNARPDGGVARCLQEAYGEAMGEACSLHFSSKLLNLLDLELSAGICRCLRQDTRLQNEILLYVYYTYISHILIYVNACLPSFKQLISRHFGRTFGPDTSRLGSQHTGSSNSARQAVNPYDNWCRNSFMKYEHVVRK